MFDHDHPFTGLRACAAEDDALDVVEIVAEPPDTEAR